MIEIEAENNVDGQAGKFTQPAKVGCEPGHGNL
jgi:hypothetical protein